MTKQQHYATSLRPAKLCRLLIITFACKLLVLGMLIFEPALPDTGFFLRSGDSADSGRATASAATPDELQEEPVGAAPALEPTLPDSAAAAPQSTGVLPGISRAPADAQSATPQEQAAQNELRDALNRRQEDLSRKEQELRVLESELAARLERMQMLENRLATMIKDAEATTDAKYRHLVDVLANMKAKQAAAVLETLDPHIAVKVLAGMRGRQAGEILTFVKPSKAAQLTESLARVQLPLE